MSDHRTFDPVDGTVERLIYHEGDGTITNHVVSTVTEDVLAEAKAIRDSKPEHGEFTGLRNSQFAHVMRLDMVFIEQMRCGQCCPEGTTYNMMSPDKDERLRALRHVQSVHPAWMTSRSRRVF